MSREGLLKEKVSVTTVMGFMIVLLLICVVETVNRISKHSVYQVV